MEVKDLNGSLPLSSSTVEHLVLDHGYWSCQNNRLKVHCFVCSWAFRWHYMAFMNTSYFQTQEWIYLQKGHYCPHGYYDNESMDVYNKDVSWYSKWYIDQFMAKLVRMYVRMITSMTGHLYRNSPVNLHLITQIFFILHPVRQIHEISYNTS